MTKRTKQAIVIGTVAAALAVGAGAAVAGGGLGFGNDQQAFLDDAAKRLGVTPAALKAALQGAYGDRLDAAVAAGKLTKEQAEAMKQRSRDGVLPFFGGGPRGGMGHGGMRHGGMGHGGPSLAAVATYLGLTEAELGTQLRAGKSLAAIAKSKDKSVDGLKKVLAAESKQKLDAAVKAGRLTQAQADEMQKRLADRLDDLVNGTRGGLGRHEGRGHGWGGPPVGVTPPATYMPSGSTSAPL